MEFLFIKLHAAGIIKAVSVKGNTLGIFRKFQAGYYLFETTLDRTARCLLKLVQMPVKEY